MELIGYTAPRYLAGIVQRRGGFLTPLFGSSSEPHVASGGRVVESFWSVAVTPGAILPVPAGALAPTLNVAEPMAFAFEAMHGEIRFGTAEDVGTFVRQQFSSFDSLPFTQTEMGHFLADLVLWEQAMDRCVTLLENERPGSGKRFALNNPYAPRGIVTTTSTTSGPNTLS